MSSSNYGYLTDSFPFPVKVVSAIISWNANYTSPNYELHAMVKVAGASTAVSYAQFTNPHSTATTQEVVGTTRYFVHPLPDSGTNDVIPAFSAIGPFTICAVADDCTINFVYEIVEE